MIRLEADPVEVEAQADRRAWLGEPEGLTAAEQAAAEADMPEGLADRIADFLLCADAEADRFARHLP